MTTQPPLFMSGDDLPSPLFSSRPGWGGQLKRWLSANIYMLIFRAILLFAVILLVIAMWDQSPSTINTPMPSASPELVPITAAPGDGMTNVAARAIDAYLASTGTRLNAPQHLFAVDTLARLVCWCPLGHAQVITFTRNDIAQVITRASALTAAQQSAWSRFLRPLLPSGLVRIE